MARVKHPTSERNMGKDRISSPSKDLMKASGTVLMSVVHGEQIHIDITANWLTNMTGCTVTAKIVEANNDGAGTIPTTEATTPVITTLTIIDSDVTDNTFKIVIPDDLIDTWSTQPSPDTPVFGYLGVEIADAGVGDAQQIWKPMRGLIEILYSPTEAS